MTSLLAMSTAERLPSAPPLPGKMGAMLRSTGNAAAMNMLIGRVTSWWAHILSTIWLTNVSRNPYYRSEARKGGTMSGALVRNRNFSILLGWLLGAHSGAIYRSRRTVGGRPGQDGRK